MVGERVHTVDGVTETEDVASPCALAFQSVCPPAIFVVAMPGTTAMTTDEQALPSCRDRSREIQTPG